MSDVDPAVIQREKDALKSAFNNRSIKAAFTYRALSLDTDRLIDDLYRDMPANPAGLSLGVVAIEFVVDCYYEHGALEPLVKAYSGHKYQVASVFDRLLARLQEAQRFDLIERLWVSVARVTRAEFFHQRPGRDHGGHERVEEHKTHALDAYAQGIDWMTRLGRLDTAGRLTAERDALREERFPSLPPPSDLRRIDEPVFWVLISKARSQAPTTLEQLAVLGDSLRAFKAADIKRFGSFYARHMRNLYHWDVWALAYAARGGCSDGAFEEFRTWLILQGDPALVALAVTAPARAAERVPPEPDLPDGTCLPLIDEAYLLRTGSTLELPSIDPGKPKGREWTEEALATTYPQLVRHYASARETGSPGSGRRHQVPPL
jgi:hypothetical protein